MRRSCLLLALVLNCAIETSPQPSNMLPLVGALNFLAGPQDATVVGLREGLRDLGYVEGRNIRIETRTAQGHVDRLPGLARELVELKADVIVTGNPFAAQAIRRASSTIPLVITTFDPVGSGLVTNLSHPEASITGVSSMSTELSAKRLQLLKEVMPQLSRVAVLWNPFNPPSTLQTRMIDELRAAAPTLGIELKVVRAGTPNELDAAFSEVSRARVQALYLLESAFFYSQKATLAKVALKAQLPAIYGTGVRRRGRTDVLRGQLRRSVASSGHVRRQDSQGRQTGRPANRAADQVRAGDQSQDRQGTPYHHPRVAPAARGRGDPVRVL